jgi:hypothetical protein
METTTQTSNNKTQTTFFRFAYGAFVLLGLYFIAFKNDWSGGVTQFGIALVFDPFNQEVKWDKRPLYQKIWLITHLVLLLIFFVLMFVKE